MLKRSSAWWQVIGVMTCAALGGCGPSVVEGPAAAGAAGTTAVGGAASGGGSSAGDGNGDSAGSIGDGGAASPAATFSPESCKAAGGVAVPSPGGQQTPQRDCESGVALGVIDAASSGWDEGGLCCAVGQDPGGKACGARAGNSCSANEYCAYGPPDICGRADAESVCKPRPTECPELYAPVCGCDQKTYDNSCFANAAGTGLYDAGACKL